MVQTKVAGVASTLPTASVARTANACDPSARSERTKGEMQVAYAATSSLHSNDDPLSVDSKSNVGEGSFDGFAGCAVIVVSGATVSIVHEYVGGTGSVFPAPS